MASSIAATMGSLFSFNGCIMGYVCEETSLISSIRTPADLAVSWLKFEPKVSNFPAVSANVADTAHAIIGSLFLFNGCKLGYVGKWTSLISSIRTPADLRFHGWYCCYRKSFLILFIKKHTKFLVCFFVLKLNYWSEIFEFNVVPQCVMVR